MTDIGLNILAQTINHDAVRAALGKLQPRAALIMDHPALAHELARTRPAMAVIHRAYREDDHRLHETITPGEFINSVWETSAHNVIVQALNEPNGYGDVSRLVTWCVQVMEAASRVRIRLALPNFAVGHPDERLIQSGAFDPFIRAFGRHPEHLFALHEYFRETPGAESDWIGRVRHWRARFERLGVRWPIVIMTEAGRDVGGGAGDGWRDTGWTPVQYLDRIRAMASVQRRHDVYSSLLFSFGSGFGSRWGSFDVNDSDLLTGIGTYNALLNGGAPYTGRVRFVMNVRQLPTVHSPVIGRVTAFQAVRVLRGTRTIRDGHMWMMRHEGGWLAVSASGMVGV